MMCPFEVGQRVVCIKDAWNVTWGEAAPVYMGIYTIRDIEPDYKNRVGLRFREIVNPALEYRDGLKETAFVWTGFKPVTDISIFKKMLVPAPVRKLEDA